MFIALFKSGGLSQLIVFIGNVSVAGSAFLEILPMSPFFKFWQPSFRRYSILFVAFVLSSGDLDAKSAIATAPAGEELLIQAVEHAGEKEIKTGEFRYTMQVTSQPPGQEKITQATESTRKAMRAAMERAENEGVKKRIQKSLDTLDDNIKSQMLRNASKTKSCYFVVGGPLLGSDRYIESSVWDGEKKKYEPATVVLQRFLGAGNYINAYCLLDNRIVHSTQGQVLTGTQEPQCLGRATGLLAGVAVLPTDPKKPITDFISNVEVGRVESDRSTEIYEVTCLVSLPGSPTATLRCQIDPSRGYITPLVQELDNQGNVMREWISSDYFKATGTELWFPKICIYRETDKAGKFARPRTERYEFSQDRTRLNIDIPAERFAITIGRGKQLLDQKKGDPVFYTASRELRVSLDDLTNPSGITGLSLRERSASRSGAKEPIEPSTRTWLIVFNLIVVMVLLFFFILKRRSRSAVAMFLIGLSLETCGCGKTLQQSTDVENAVIRVIPESIELGEIASGGPEVTSSVRVENRAAHDVQIQIRPSCGCTTLDSDRFVLQTGAARDVGLAMKSTRRVGDFRGTLQIVAKILKKDEKSQHVDVPIRARFRDDWSCQPNRVLLSIDCSGVLGGIFSVSAPADAWDGVEMNTENPGIEVLTSSSQTEGSLETRNYRITATNVPGGNYPISFFRGEQKRPFLVVPLLVRAN